MRQYFQFITNCSYRAPKVDALKHVLRLSGDWTIFSNQKFSNYLLQRPSFKPLPEQYHIHPSCYYDIDRRWLAWHLWTSHRLQLACKQSTLDFDRNRTLNLQFRRNAKVLNHSFNNISFRCYLSKEAQAVSFSWLFCSSFWLSKGFAAKLMNSHCPYLLGLTAEGTLTSFDIDNVDIILAVLW